MLDVAERGLCDVKFALPQQQDVLLLRGGEGKPALWERAFRCDACGIVLDRDEKNNGTGLPQARY